MKVLDLFSGIGGFSLGLERAGMETAAFCEIDKYCQKVLKKHWPDVPVYDDIRTLDYDGTVDVICGGFPCQPFSVAGQQRGEEDDRHLWPEMLACIKRYQPRWVIGENVTGIINLAIDTVLSELESAGYTCQTLVIPACAINAPHRRDRVWIVANRHGQPSAITGDDNANAGESLQRGNHARGSGGDDWREFGTGEDGEDVGNTGICKSYWLPNFKREKIPAVRGTGKNVSDTTSQRYQGQGEYVNACESQADREGEASKPFNASIGNQWAVEPDVGRVANGISHRVDRLRALGNAVVPQIPEIIGRAIIQLEYQASNAV